MFKDFEFFKTSFSDLLDVTCRENSSFAFYDVKLSIAFWTDVVD